MSHSETYEEVFNFFDEWEDEAIESWLKDRGYNWDHPTLCGSCCGFYDQEYWVQFREGDIAVFNAFASERGIGAVATSGHITIGDPRRGN